MRRPRLRLPTTRSWYFASDEDFGSWRALWIAMGRGSRKVGPFRRATVSCGVFGTCTTAFLLPASPFEREDGAASGPSRPAPGRPGPLRPGRRLRRLEPHRPHAIAQSEPHAPAGRDHNGRLHAVDHAVRVLRYVAHADHVPDGGGRRGRDDS